MDFAYLRDILDDLQFRFDCKFQSDSFQLQRQLGVLNHLEKQLIRKKVLEFEYNIGSLRVIKILNTVGIMNITDYLLKVNNDELIQAILTDILDLPEMHQLLLEVIINDNQIQTIKSNFAQCFSQYVTDLLDKHELIKNEFICKIHHDMECNQFWVSIGQVFLQELLTREQHTNELTKVLGNQKCWNDQFNDEKLVLVKKIVSLICSKHTAAVLKMLLPQLTNHSKVNWFYALMIINLLGSETIAEEDIKKFLKSNLNKFHETQNVGHFIIVLMIARQVHYYSVNPKSTYQSWVKTNIGEMHYTLKDQEKFCFTLETLVNLISYETDPEVLDVHGKVSISAPRGVNNRVLEYKMMLRTKSAGLTTAPEVFMDLT